MGTIYRYVNKINGKGYTGKTERDVKIRDWCHRSGRGSKVLKAAMDKYGENNFTLIIIEDGITSEFLNEREKYWIAYFNDFRNGYNRTEGGDGQTSESMQGKNNPMYGKKHSAESIQKMSGENNSMYGKTGESNPFYNKKHSLESREKMSESTKGENHPMYGKKGENHPNYGKKHSAKSIQKMSAAQSGRNNGMYGRKHRAQTIKKISESIKGENHPMYGKKGENAVATRPEYAEARWFFLLLPMDMDIKEKRKIFLKAFSQIPRTTIYRWFQDFQREFKS